MEPTDTPSQRRRWPAFSLLLVALLLGSVVACDRHPAWTSNSYYVGSTDQKAMSLLGCHNGNKQGRMTLFFGAPTTADGRYGATMWARRDQTTGKVAELVKDFVRGFVWCRESRYYQLFVGIGTSNSALDSKTYGWIYRHGRAWSAMVRSVAAWADRHYPGIVRIYGAWDAEPSWSRRPRASQWMDGYESVRNHRPVHANFSADGCSPTSSSNSSCNNGWSQRYIWNLAWGRRPSLPQPQIYANSGVNARQWQQIALYGVRYRGRQMHFQGTMTQASACRQVGGCVGTTNEPHDAHDQMLHYLNHDRRTSQAQIYSTTDMRWHS